MLLSISQEGGVDIVGFGEGETMNQDYRCRWRSGDFIGHEGHNNSASKSLGREVGMLSTCFRRFKGRDLDALTGFAY